MVNAKKYWKQALYLAWFTIAYNVVEAAVAIFFGFEQESYTLAGFGGDSLVETVSAIGILLLVRREGKGQKQEGEIMALRITGVSFYLLATILVASAIYSIAVGLKPEEGTAGIIISLISILFMWILIRWKTSLGKKLNSSAMIADAKCNLVCLYMSIILLASSGLYEITHWPYWDALGLAGLAWFSISEGKESLEKANNPDLDCNC